MLSLSILWDALIDLTVKGSLLLCVAWLGVRLLRLRAPAQRAAWIAAFGALPLLPLAGLVSIAPWKVATPFPTAASRVDIVPAVTSQISILEVIVPLWLAGCGLALTILAAAHLRVRRLLVRGIQVDIMLLQQTSADSRVRRPWSLLEAPAAVGPFTYGLFRPKIVLPLGWRDWPEPQLQTVLLHELAHVRALDALVLNAATVLCCFQWFNPLGLLALGQLRKACESAADLAVLEAGVPASDYAETLLAMATGHRRFAAALPFGAPPLHGRITQLFANARAERTTARHRLAFVIAPVVAAAFGLAVVRFVGTAAANLGRTADQWVAKVARTPKPLPVAFKPVSQPSVTSVGTRRRRAGSSRTAIRIPSGRRSQPLEAAKPRIQAGSVPQPIALDKPSHTEVHSSNPSPARMDVFEPPAPRFARLADRPAKAEEAMPVTETISKIDEKPVRTTVALVAEKPTKN